ncbi:MAG: DNA/RNA nuclease SfsA [Gammaproteobacteria bacterium]|nr:MAG: DNA/RNA nuclease SfsA [Gammaproteobacteria bacterium]
MKLKLNSATLIKRYKRFLADVILEDGTTTTTHVANTGAMSGCAEAGNTIWYSTSNNPKRKYPFSWELTQTSQGDFICVNTIRANQLVAEALKNNIISELTGYKTIIPEKKYGSENSKIDFFLSDNQQGLADVYVEVKSVTLLDGSSENGQGYFPDTITTRGQKHLRELIEVAKSGDRAVLLFAILHSGINSVKAAAHIDADYAQLLEQAKNSGVDVLTYKAKISTDKIILQPLAELT